MNDNKLTFLIFFGSLLITALVSSLFGFIGPSIAGTFWGWFCVSMIMQILGFVVVNSFLIQRDIIAQQFIQTSPKKFTIKLNCSYCQQPNFCEVDVNQKNTFQCESCNQINGILMQFTATTLTSPIESVKIPVESSNDVEFKVS